MTNDERLMHLITCAFKSLKGNLIVDLDGTILYYSDEHEKYTGIPREKAIGHHVKEILPNTRMHKVAETGEPECGMVFYFKHAITGEVTPCICNRIPIMENGKIIGVMSETTFTKGFHDVDILHEEIKNVSFNPVVVHSPVELNSNSLDNICGTSKVMSELKLALPKFADFSLPILITGESGTGKEVFASALHQLSYRRMRPFVKINCAAIPAPLLESELFGYEAGAFSGASKNGKKGKFEYVSNGTILLDEIGDMPLELQAKLLRVLQEKEFERVGGLKTIPFTARVICTTNQNIPELIQKGKFREDLYYRINVLEMKIPPLRDRLDDIDDFVSFFIKEMNMQEGTSIDDIDDESLELLKSFSWPGNIRELRHVVQRACILRGAGTLCIEDFNQLKSDFVSKKTMFKEEQEEVPNFTLENAKNQAEIKAIKAALVKSKNNKTMAAEILGIDRTVLYSKLKKYGIDL